MNASADTVLDCIVVGAGFGGLYSAYKLREIGLRFQGFEAAPDVGGVWFWNRYPGARCDVESLQYSYSFSEELQQEWAWSERFAQQPEILGYINHVADRFDLRRSFRFNTRVVAASFDDIEKCWTVTTDTGDALRTKFLIMASGGLSVPRLPDIPGIADYKGTILHTGAWPHEEVDFAGKRVGVIGTGSSGVQSIPQIAKTAEHVTVFQRTANFIVPARNRPLSETEQARWKAQYSEKRSQAKRVGTLYEFSHRSALDVDEAERRAEYDRRWQVGGVNFVHAFNDIGVNEAANATAADYVRERIREIVKDPEVAERLCPKDHPLGAKRIVVGTDYFETFNRPNVTLVDLKADPILHVEEKAVVTSTGARELDILVLATGFDALTGALTEIDIRGRGGRKLTDAWKDGPGNYLGLMVADFPNMFVITGPGSPSVLVNMIVGIEQHVEWITDLLIHMRDARLATIEPDAAAQHQWVEHVNESANATLFVKAKSWYLGANIEGKPRVFMPYVGGIAKYRDKCDQVAAAGYAGFILDADK